MNGTKAMKKKVNQLEETIAEGVKLITRKRKIQKELDDTAKSVIL